MWSSTFNRVTFIYLQISPSFMNQERLRNLELEALVLEIELPQGGGSGTGGPAGKGGGGGGGGGAFSFDLGNAGQQGLAISLERFMGNRKEKKKMTVAEVSASYAVKVRSLPAPTVSVSSSRDGWL